MFGKGTKEIDTLVQTVKIVSGDIRMEFGIEKFANVNIQKGKVTWAEGIQLPDAGAFLDIFGPVGRSPIWGPSYGVGGEQSEPK